MSVLNVFGSNLRLLIRSRGTISAVAAELGISRVQITRFLQSESFPKPNVLQRICRFFGTDARILTEKLGPDLRFTSASTLTHPFLRGTGLEMVQAQNGSRMPAGNYLVTRRGQLRPDLYLMNVLVLREIDGGVYLRGFDPPAGQIGFDGELLSRSQREYRGVVVPQQGRELLLVGNRASLTLEALSVQVITTASAPVWRGLSFALDEIPNNAWTQTPVVLEPVGATMADLRRAVSMRGYVREADLMPHRRAHLQAVAL